MYKEVSTPVNTSMSDHLRAATAFANSSYEAFEPHLLNEILKEIRRIWAEKRAIEIEKSEKYTQYLRDSLSNL